MQKQIAILADRRIGRSLLQLTIPAFFGMLVMTLYNVVDTIFIGRYVGPLGIAGLSIVFPIQMLAMGMGQMAGMGGASLISRLLGEGKDSRAQRALGNSLSSMAVLTMIVLIAGEVAPDLWLRLIGSSETILPYAREYLVIILVGMVFQTISMAFNGLVRAEGNARVAMMGMIVGAGLNIVLDAIFVVLLEMGIAGAAWATVIAMLCSTLYFLGYYRSGKSHLRITRRDLVFDFSILKPIYSIGIASLVMTMANSLSVIVINRLLGYYGGDYAISTFGIINRIIMFAIMPGLVISQGLQPILGYNYGARRYGLALKSILIAIGWSTGFCVVSFCLLYFLPHVFIKIFTNDPQLISEAVHASKRIFFFIYLVGVAFVGMMSFQALGKVFRAFITSAARPALFMIPLVLIMSHFWGTDGVWWGFATTDALTAVMVSILLVRQMQEFRRKSQQSTALKDTAQSGQEEFFQPVD